MKQNCRQNDETKWWAKSDEKNYGQLRNKMHKAVQHNKER